MKDETLHKAFENWEVLSSTKEEILAYRARVKQLFDEEAMMIEAEMRVKEGIEKGIEQGIVQGIEQGIEAGTINIAQQLLTLGMDVEFVMQATGLSKEKVLDLGGK